jgi:vacuolar protein sorting-associated protein 35
VFGSDNREALAHKAGTYCAKLLKRPDQCLAVLSCSHLHWQEQAEVSNR